MTLNFDGMSFALSTLSVSVVSVHVFSDEAKLALLYNGGAPSTGIHKSYDMELLQLDHLSDLKWVLSSEEVDLI